MGEKVGHAQARPGGSTRSAIAMHPRAVGTRPQRIRLESERAAIRCVVGSLRGHSDTSAMCTTCRSNDDLHTLVERYKCLHQTLKGDVLELVPAHL